MQKSKQLINGYEITKELGSGSFGSIYLALKDQKQYAIKIQNLHNMKSMLSLEYQIYQKLHEKKPTGGYDFPQVFAYGEENNFSFMVMEKFDLTLQQVVNSYLKNQLKKDSIISIMYNTLKSIELLHSIGYICRDVKPANFMLKVKQFGDTKSPPILSSPKLYIIDLGLCKKFNKNNEHIPLKNNKKLVGTPLFCSLNIHKGLEISRRDDLQSWIYMTIYLVKKLPWEEVSNSLVREENKKENKENIYQKIKMIKESSPIQNMIKGEKLLPSCIGRIYEHIKYLQFDGQPNYNLIYRLLQEQFEKLVGKGSKSKLECFSFESRISQQVKQEKKIKINFKVPIKSTLKQNNSMPNKTELG